MVENHRLYSKTRRIFYLIITAVIMVSFIAPLSTKKAYALSAPQLLYPKDGDPTTSETDPPLGVPNFEWSTVSGANVYRLQVDSELGFNQPLTIDINTRNTTFTPTAYWGLLSDGEWFWRVRVEDPQPVGEWSTVFRFTKTWAMPENKPTLLAPLEGESLAFFDAPTFSWTPVMGASSYRLQFALTSYGFDAPVYSQDTLATTFQPPMRLTNGIYYWRVVPLDYVAHLGTPSDVLSFVTEYGKAGQGMIPTLVSPPDEDHPVFTPTFHWTAVEGAEHYRLEYTSDETCDFSVGNYVETKETSWTPTQTFPNDFRYCWHVRVEAGSAVGDWSPTWHFEKHWGLKPVLLTPTHLYQTGLYPFFSWTPVPGAAMYLIQIGTDPYVNNVIEWTVTANTTYAARGAIGAGHYWWHVRPIDGSGNNGAEYSETEEFISVNNSLAPIQVYPQYYYPPNDYEGFPISPYEDRTVALPIFTWQRVINYPNGGATIPAYRIEVADSPYFEPVIWSYDTENTSATPIAENDFLPVNDQDYFWRVCPLNSMGGDCLINPSGGLPWWSQAWSTHFSSTLELTATVGVSPTLLRPAIGQEVVEATPLLEWWPLEGATQYEVEVSRDADFSTNEFSQLVNIPAYSPSYSLAQRSLGRTDYGTFYWHVRAYTAGGWGEWSDTWRFQVASQSEWRTIRYRNGGENKLLIGEDIPDDAGISYDLTTLYASQSLNYWYFGFDAYTVTLNATFVLYVDLDNVSGSGAVAPPERNYLVTTNPEHQPEFAIYVDVVGGAISPHESRVYAWDQINHHWEYGQRFEEIGAYIQQYLGGYIEMELPYSAIGMNDTTSSASVMLFTVDVATGQVQDTVPSNEVSAAGTLLTRFSAVSEHMNLLYPFSTVSGDPTTSASLPPFYWDWPTGDNGATPFSGYTIEVYVDQDYTPPAKAWMTINGSPYLMTNHATFDNDLVGDNIYYWRVRPLYSGGGGGWTSGWSFNRHGFTPQDLTTSVTFATPTFSWSMAEGAMQYVLQVATDPNFGNVVINIATPMNTYTPPDTLPQDLYYWRVGIIRWNSGSNDWSKVEQFDLSYLTPENLLPDNGDIIHTTPTFCWDPVVGDLGGEKVMAAYQYYLQVSTDPEFSNPWYYQTPNNCFTPSDGYDDRTYYWRVAMIDGSGRMGSFSTPAFFTKQYPKTELISPVFGSVPGTPTFIWKPVDGAATYLLEVSQFPTFFPVYDSVEAIGIQYTPYGTYQTDKEYYWRVAIRDIDGKLGPFTDAIIDVGDTFPTFMPLAFK